MDDKVCFITILLTNIGFNRLTLMTRVKFKITCNCFIFFYFLEKGIERWKVFLKASSNFFHTCFDFEELEENLDYRKNKFERILISFEASLIFLILRIRRIWIVNNFSFL